MIRSETVLTIALDKIKECGNVPEKLQKLILSSHRRLRIVSNLECFNIYWPNINVLSGMQIIIHGETIDTIQENSQDVTLK